MTKRLVFFLFLMGSFSFFLPKNYAQSDSLILRWEMTRTCQNDTLLAQLKSSGFSAINGIQLSVNWETNNFQYLNYELNQLASGVVGDNQITGGQLSFIWSAPTSQTFSSEIPLLTIRFLPKKCGNFKDEIRLTDAPVPIRVATVTSDGKVERIPVKIMNSDFVIDNCLTLLVQPDNTSLCVGDSVEISAFCNDCQYNWSNGASTSTILVQEGGTYQVAANTTENCMAIDSVTIEFSSLPDLGLGNDTTICQEDYEISVNTDAANMVLWNTGETTEAINVFQTGNYSVIVTNENNCTAKDTIRIDLTSPLVAEIAAEKDLLCPGDSLVLMPIDGDFATWLDTSATTNLRRDSFRLSATVRPNITTTYFLTVGNACTLDTTSITIEVLPTNVSAGQDTCIGIGSTIQLNAQNALSYDWQPNIFPVSNRMIANPSIQPEESTFYVLSAIDSNNCPVIDSVGIFVADNPALAIDKINFLTPNGDGFNDFLEFKNLEKFGFNSLKIYNRQGTPVYEKLNYQRDTDRWNGNFQTTNIKLPAGVYFYILQVAGEEIKQTLNLVR